MLRTNLLLPGSLCGLLLLAGCATPVSPDVGRVVVAPQIQPPPVPLIVQQTPAKTAGYFQSLLLTTFGGSP